MNRPVDAQEFHGEASYLAPWSKSRAEFAVPARFSAALGRHLRSNFCETAAMSRPALFLAVQGPPGEGKTEMVNRCCSQMGCNVFNISAAALSGKHEGDASQVLLRSAAKARRVALTNDRPSVLVIDDMDRGVAALHSATGHTVNSGLLVGTLQDLANDIHDASGERALCRVPIVMTANSFTSLTGSLIRPGRTSFFSWRPTWQEKAAMALPIFGPRTAAERAALQRMVRWYHYLGEPLAFFVQLAHEYMGAAAPWPCDCTDILQAAEALSLRTEAALTALDFRVLRRVAWQLHRGKAQSFLRGEAADV